MTALLEVRGLRTGYGDITAVRDVSLAVGAGEVVSVLGRNGAGKTTSLRGITGLNPSPSGSVWFEGADISRLPAHRRSGLGLALVQEGKRIFRRRTVEENLVVGGFVTRLGRGALRPRLEEAYARFPVLADRRDDPAGSLSGGQQQMLAIAQALISHPRVLMLDEPSAGLAPSIVGDLAAVIRQLRGDGLGIVLVEQAVEMALSLADHVVVLDLGRTVLSAPATEPNLRSRIAEAYLSRDGAAAPSAPSEGRR